MHIFILPWAALFLQPLLKGVGEVFLGDCWAAMLLSLRGCYKELPRLHGQPPLASLPLKEPAPARG